MTEQATRYLAIADELKSVDATSPRYGDLIAEADRIWWMLSESEHEQIEGLLFAIDEVDRTGKGYPPAEIVGDD